MPHNALSDLRRLARRRQKLHADLAEVDQQIQAAVRAAFDAGETWAPISAELGLTKARVYQIRDGRR